MPFVKYLSEYRHGKIGSPRGWKQMDDCGDNRHDRYFIYFI